MFGFFNNINNINRNGYTQLMLAAQKGDVAKVKALIAQSADLNLAEKSLKMTALMYAAREGHVEIVDLLIRAKAEINSCNAYKNTALMLAFSYNRREAAFCLLAAGAVRPPESLTANIGNISEIIQDFNQCRINNILISLFSKAQIRQMPQSDQRGFFEMPAVLQQKVIDYLLVPSKNNASIQISPIYTILFTKLRTAALAAPAAASIEPEPEQLFGLRLADFKNSLFF